jgi:arylsulfatase A-like enzyme
VISATAQKDAYVRAIVFRGGKPMAGSTTSERIRGHETRPGVAILDLPSTLRHPGHCERLVIYAVSTSPFIDLHSIDLLSVPMGDWVPDPEGAGELVEVAGEGRRAVGLANNRPLEVEFQATERAWLAFTLAIPDGLRYARMNPVVQVTLEGRNGRRSVSRHSLETRLEGFSRWHAERLSLAEFAGQRVHALFELETRDMQREAWCVVAEPRITKAGANAPTVVLITSDTHRADHVRASGSAVDLRTPNLDRLAQRGVFFEDCFSSTNITNPSHVALMTGRSPRDTGIHSNYTPLSIDAPTLAEAFRDAGWQCFAAVSTPHLGNAGSGLGQGFDRMSTPRTPKRRVSETITAIESWLPDAEGLPLFVWLHVFDAHTPYDPPGEFDRSYYPKDRDPFDPALPDPGIPEEYAEREFPGLRDLEFPRAQYRAEVTYLDSQVERVFSHPRLGQGILALTADHGESLGEHEIYWDHAGLYPESIHIPLILTWPEAPAGARISAPVSQIDVGRTLLDLAGQEQRSFPGTSLLSAIQGQGTPSRPRFTLADKGFSAAVTRDGWHLIMHLRKHLITVSGRRVAAPMHGVELYDLKQDAACANDLAKTELERAKQLRRLLIAWLGAADMQDWATEGKQDARTLQDMAQLGYTDSSPRSDKPWFEPDHCEQCAVFE